MCVESEVLERIVHCVSNLQVYLAWSYITQCTIHPDFQDLRFYTCVHIQATPTQFAPCGCNHDQCIGRFWNFASVCRWLENSATWGSDEQSNVTNIAIYFNGKLALAGSPTYPKRDATLTIFHCLLLGKVHSIGLTYLKMSKVSEVRKSPTIERQAPMVLI